MSELEIIRHQQIDGISVFFDAVEYRTPHFHPEWELIWITEGVLSVQCSQQNVSGQPGDLFLFYPNQLHEFRQLEAGATFLCLQVSPLVFRLSCPELQTIATESFCASDYLTEKLRAGIRRQMKDLARHYLDRDSFFTLRCTGEAADILCRLLTVIPTHRMTPEELAHADKRNARLSRFLDYVEQNYSRRLSLSEFAAQEGCTVSYLSRFLRQNMNQTFQDYVNMVRFHSACRMIQAGGMRMLDVCEEAGFSDYRYFSNCFKKQCGLTPEEYSRRAVPPTTAAAPVRRSISSVERFFSPEESDRLLRALP